LFALALLAKGLGHGLFLEAGVLLVSIQLILMAKKNAETESRLEKRFTRIDGLLRALRDRQDLKKKT
jgi:hypothetical protein